MIFINNRWRFKQLVERKLYTWKSRGLHHFLSTWSRNCLLLDNFLLGYTYKWCFHKKCIELHLFKSSSYKKFHLRWLSHLTCAFLYASRNCSCFLLFKKVGLIYYHYISYHKRNKHICLFICLYTCT